MRIRTTYTNQDEAPLAAVDVPDRPSGHPTSPSDTAVLGWHQARLVRIADGSAEVLRATSPGP